jgi:acetoacetyl-CoA synthetase
VEELARSYIESIRTIQPHGPYHLAGYSFGGILAYEIAQQMRQAGEEIGLLFLLDPSEPFEVERAANSATETASAKRESKSGRIIRHLRYLAKHPGETVPYVVPRTIGYVKNGPWAWLCYQLVHLYGKSANPIFTRLLPKNRWPAFRFVTKRLGKPYHPAPYEGNVLAVFLNRGHGSDMWRPFLGETADIRFVDAKHSELFSEPSLSQWLEILSAQLDEAP